jgi:hypothetical protein
MIKATELFPQHSLSWKNLEAHCFDCFVGESVTKYSEHNKLPDSSKTVKQFCGDNHLVIGARVC